MHYDRKEKKIIFDRLAFCILWLIFSYFAGIIMKKLKFFNQLEIKRTSFLNIFSYLIYSCFPREKIGLETMTSYNFLLLISRIFNSSR